MAILVGLCCYLLVSLVPKFTLITDPKTNWKFQPYHFLENKSKLLFLHVRAINGITFCI